jgi:hypothetical protein
MARSSLAAIGVGLLLSALLAGCEPAQKPAPSVGSNSNWLRACDIQKDCGKIPECTCGVCTAECSSDADCKDLTNARCALDADPAARATCESAGGGAMQGICLPRCEPGDCGQGQACVGGACVLSNLPDNAFCADVLEASVADRTHEDELLALVQDNRVNGFTCGGAAATAQAAFRFDPRLVCAARVLAADIESTRMANLIDSAGRSSTQRLTLAGYGATQWGESYAIEASSAAQALAYVLKDPGSCARLSSAAYTDIGIGSSGDVHVITIAAD